MKRNYASIKNKSEWTWRTNPRTITRLIERLKVFAEFSDMKDTHELRKEYSKKVNFNAQKRGKDDEAQYRQDKVTFELFGLGYVNKEKMIVITSAGEVFLDEEKADLWQNIFIRQLSKYQIPNSNQHNRIVQDIKIFPLKLILDLIEELGHLNQYEIGLVCFNTKTNSNEDLKKSISIIKEFRNKLPPGKKRDNAKRVFEELYSKNWKGHNHKTAIGKVTAFCTSLEYTGLISLSGRGYFTKLRIRDFFKKKAEALRKFNFEFNSDYLKKDIFFKKHGDVSYPKLPWENKEKLKEILKDKIKKVYKKEIQEIHIEEYDNISKLERLDVKIDKSLLEQEKEKYIFETSKTSRERESILEELFIIDEKPDSINNPALKLENLIWKSLIALEGNSHEVKENFKLNPDLSIKNYAPGAGNTPDIEFYNGDFIFIVEVTLLRGNAQHRAEGMSVLDHTEKFIKVQYGEKLQKKEVESLRGSLIREKDNRKIYGLFISPKIGDRTLKQFYSAGKAEIYEYKTPIVSIDLNVYLKILKHCYKNNISAYRFEKLIDNIGDKIKTTKNPKEWVEEKNILIEEFLKFKPRLKY